MLKPPLILTLAINPEAFVLFDELRKKHFPPSLNFINAHLTLFHALPNASNIISAVKELCKQQASFALTVTEPVSIGKGVAFKMESNELKLLHKSLQNGWQNFLKPQDRQKIWPHITVQNKVTAGEAQKLLNELKSTFIPFKVQAKGLQLWEYLNGPWKLIDEFYFEGDKY